MRSKVNTILGFLQEWSIAALFTYQVCSKSTMVILSGFIFILSIGKICCNFRKLILEPFVISTLLILVCGSLLMLGNSNGLVTRLDRAILYFSDAFAAIAIYMVLRVAEKGQLIKIIDRSLIGIAISLIIGFFIQDNFRNSGFTYEPSIVVYTTICLTISLYILKKNASEFGMWKLAPILVLFVPSKLHFITLAIFAFHKPARDTIKILYDKCGPYKRYIVYFILMYLIINIWQRHGSIYMLINALYQMIEVFFTFSNSGQIPLTQSFFVRSVSILNALMNFLNSPLGLGWGGIGGTTTGGIMTNLLQYIIPSKEIQYGEVYPGVEAELTAKSYLLDILTALGLLPTLLLAMIYLRRCRTKVIYSWNDPIIMKTVILFLAMTSVVESIYGWQLAAVLSVVSIAKNEI